MHLITQSLWERSKATWTTFSQNNQFIYQRAFVIVPVRKKKFTPFNTTCTVHDPAHGQVLHLYARFKLNFFHTTEDTYLIRKKAGIQAKIPWEKDKFKRDQLALCMGITECTSWHKYIHPCYQIMYLVVHFCNPGNYTLHKWTNKCNEIVCLKVFQNYFSQKASFAKRLCKTSSMFSHGD